MTAELDKLIARLREMEAKATKGPWTAPGSVPSDGFDCHWLTGGNGEDLGYLKRNAANADFIALSRSLFLPLLGCVEALNDAALMFRLYERLHLAKEPPDTVKANNNARMASVCEAALAELQRAASTAEKDS